MHTRTETPIIKTFRSSETFSYLWLKYIKGFDLSQHCARCLLGEYSQAFAYGERNHDVDDFELNEHPARYYYLCGVTKPYRWKENLHIAFEYSEGGIIDYDDGKTHVVIENAKRIPIISRSYYDILHGGEKAYNTCRNWQFAYAMTHKDG